ncbi:ATP-binding protein [bacterium]|nr:ATP-binding protein [candidate division CSSED10-310 bacterium]
MKRYLIQDIKNDLKQKIVLLTGARQSGKATLSRMISESYDYFNYDSMDHRYGIHEKSWDRTREIIIFDELHKMKSWKSWLKGVYDTEGIPPAILVTGSARLDMYLKMGDSLAGRFFQFRLHPFDLKEISQMGDTAGSEKDLDVLLECGGFPEPFLAGTTRFYNRWKKSHLDIILRQDLLDLENVRQITQMELLIELLRNRVGSPVSYSSLSRDLQCSDKTVKRWLAILENLYVIFKVTPYHRNIARALQKAPKYYFYDTGQVTGNPGLRLENTVACALLKEIHYREDALGENWKLHFLKNKEGRELDFCIVSEGKPRWMIEVKWKEDSPSPNFDAFRSDLPDVNMIQLVRELKREKTYPNGVEIRPAHKWLCSVPLV